MPHKVVVVSWAGKDVAFMADNLEQYFSIEKPYRLPLVPYPIEWIQNLRGRCISLFSWWSVLHSHDVKGFHCDSKITANACRHALLYSFGSAQVGFPVDEVKAIRLLEDNHIGSVSGGMASDWIKGSIEGMLWLDPFALFQQALDTQKDKS